MQVQVSKGLATWAGIVGALGQYAAAVAVFLNDPDKATAAAPLGTATVTLVTLIVGRMWQAKEMAWVNTQPSIAAALAEREASTVAAGQVVASSTPRPMVEFTNASAPPSRRVPQQDVPEFDPKLEVPGGSVRVPKAVAK